MKKIRILFQGDSITDAGRDKRNYHHLGMGYPKFTAPLIEAAYPDVEFEFINFGISGNRTGQLFDRLSQDCIAFQPDIVSILIGVNDVWHRHSPDNVKTTDEQVALNYKCILERIKKETNAKIMVMVPFVLDYDDEMRRHIREELPSIQKIVYELADEYADVCIPLDKYFAEALPNQPQALYYSPDGVHPNPNGAAFIAKHYLEAIKPLINDLLSLERK